MKIKDPKEYALYLLKFKDRSEKTVLEKMTEKGFDQKEIQEVLKFLKEKNFVDDLRLARIVVKDGLQYKYWGRYRIQKKLITEKVKKEVGQRAISEISVEDEIKSAKKATNNYLKKNKINDYKDKQKLFGYLSRRGFSYEIISNLEIDLYS